MTKDDPAKRKADAEKDRRKARGRIDADAQSKRPIKNVDVRDMARAAEREGRARQELAMKRDAERKAREQAKKDAKKGKGR